MFSQVPVVLVAVVGLVVLLVVVGVLIASRYKVAGPNEAFIVTGRKGKEIRNAETGAVSTDLSGQKVVMGGGIFVVPFVQRLHVLDLSSRRIMVQIRGAVSGQGVKLNLDGVALVKVGGNEDSIRAAAQRFLTQQREIETFTQETLAGSLRSIVGSLTVEQIIRDRAAFAQRVADESETSLTGQGLVLDTFQIQDITDDGTYLLDLGRPEAARVGQTAAIAEANAPSPRPTVTRRSSLRRKRSPCGRPRSPSVSSTPRSADRPTRRATGSNRRQKAAESRLLPRPRPAKRRPSQLLRPMPRRPSSPVRLRRLAAPPSLRPKPSKVSSVVKRRRRDGLPRPTHFGPKVGPRPRRSSPPERPRPRR
jgi:regulator of protease activity HflC (stomatin/prohibitin superfamily)